MGVYIKGFRKPTYCQECPLTFDYDCMIQHEERDSLIDQYKHCPLVEVKTPHGRLIDEKNILRFFNTHDGNLAVIEAEVE